MPGIFHFHTPYTNGGRVNSGEQKEKHPRFQGVFITFLKCNW